MQNNKPLAQVIYKCNQCGSDHIKLYELYFELILKYDTKYCATCRAITRHLKILPTDDNVMQYERPTLFTKNQ